MSCEWKEGGHIVGLGYRLLNRFVALVALGSAFQNQLRPVMQEWSKVSMLGIRFLRPYLNCP